MTIKTYIRKTLLIVFCSLLILPLLWNLLRPGFYTSDDGEWMVIRLTAFHDAIRQGQLPVRWLPRLNHGYGYPVTNFLYPLPFYLAEPVYLLTGNPSTAIQFIMAISVISMAVGIFALFSPSSLFLLPSSFKRSWPALVGSIAYVYSPYVAFNLYQRGSLGEIVAMGIVPWIFWAISKNRLSLAAILTAGLILSHNVVAILFLPLILIYGYGSNGSYGSHRSHGTQVMFVALSLGLSAFFWMPALYEMRFVRASQISISDFQNEYLTLSEALNRSGIVTTIFSAGTPLFFLTKSSSWFWETLKFAQIIQFPWRLLSLFSFIAAVMAFRLMRLIGHMSHMSRMGIPIGIILLLIAFSSSVRYLRPESFVGRPPEYYATNDDTTTVRAEYTPKWVQNLPTNRPETGDRHYYPGWRAFDNGRQVELTDPNETEGILRANVHDLGKVKFVFGETLFRTFANLISLTTLLLVLKKIY